jgi:two-component system invasion response regulator UvrY
VVRATPGFRWAGEAQSGEDAIEAVGKLHPDLVLLDVRMPGVGGIEAARRIAGEHPDVVVVLITVDDDREGIEHDVEASGAAELIGKQRFGPAMLRTLWDRHGTGG